MKFISADRYPIELEKDTAYLIKVSWNDYWEFETKFRLLYSDDNKVEFNFGYLKLGRRGVGPGTVDNYPDLGLPDSFEALSDDFFSVGLDVSYYEEINKLGSKFRQNLLESLNDVALRIDLLEEVKDLHIAKRSIFRDLSLNLIKNKYHEIATGKFEINGFDYQFRIENIKKPDSTQSDYVDINFKVDPESVLPSNIHVLIGRNGVGKSNALKQMANQLVEKPDLKATNVISVSFSVFDEVEIPNSFDYADTKFHYVGIRKPSDESESRKDELGILGTQKYEQAFSQSELANEFFESLKDCLGAPKKNRFYNALENLQNDRIFEQIRLLQNIKNIDEEIPAETAYNLIKDFSKLSSGHQIVLLSITKLVSLIQEESIVLLDEPESHLHPPLLSAFINSLSALLTKQNGMAIIATHSPVILQEVPKSCVTIMERQRHEMYISEPSIETYGENVGVLTNEIFGLEVKLTGFYRKLLEMSEQFASYEEAMDSINWQLGEEGRSLLHNYIYLRNSRSKQIMPWDNPEMHLGA